MHKLRLVWLVGDHTTFEQDWIEELFSFVDHEIIHAKPCDELYTNSVLIFNHVMDYESYLEKYEHAHIPYSVVHLSDETLGDTFRYIDHDMCKFVIRTYVHPLVYHHHKVLTIGLGYKTGFTNVKDLPNDHREYAWNFAGCIHGTHRMHAIQAFHQVTPYFLETSGKAFNEAKLSVEEYRRILNRSMFTLCPIGQGNIDSFRVYEALEAGSIPIVLRNTPVQPYEPSYWNYLFSVTTEVPFVMGTSWEECACKVQAILSTPGKYEQLQKGAYEFWLEAKTRWKKTIQRSVMHDDLSYVEGI